MKMKNYQGIACLFVPPDALPAASWPLNDRPGTALITSPMLFASLSRLRIATQYVM